MAFKLTTAVPGYSGLPFLRYGYKMCIIPELTTFSNGVTRQFCDNQIVK